ncbi:MAG: FAD-dependent oxidoreductase [SAR324 cluster bacterium]|uniref:NADH:ubiquinone reductase (non-electrogenic) n=1 Tax=SAR324 cluster bacterium TaxID=2024889 RepID=A0A2A4SZI4_9DELT|nr:MAG: FAD-dependent oxidoreductase [SAR324 cluster bacterium]
MKRILIVGGGFAGLNAAKCLGNVKDVEVTLIDRRNHHLFQPLLYQVAMAGLSPAEIAAPIRSMLSKYRNINVLQEEVQTVDPVKKSISTNVDSYSYDYLIMACGARHSYFGHEEWEEYAPGLKTLEQATEIRRRVLTAFEEAEKEKSPVIQKKWLTFVIVGGGPTGVELAGAIGEMSRYTLNEDFRNIDPKLTRIILVEAGPRILPSFSEKLTSRATRDLEKLGVQVWTSSMVTHIDEQGVEIGSERIQSATVIWAAGVQASSLGESLEVPLDRQRRVIVEPDLSLKEYPEVFVIGDQAHCAHQNGKPLPGVAPVAFQQGRFIGQNILREIKGIDRLEFRYLDKGQMATIGKSKAIVETGRLKIGGFIAWVAWLLIHIYYLTGFKNRLFVTLNWAWSYLTFRRGARLVVSKEWRFHPDKAKHHRDTHSS